MAYVFVVLFCFYTGPFLRDLLDYVCFNRFKKGTFQRFTSLDSVLVQARLCLSIWAGVARG